MARTRLRTKLPLLERWRLFVQGRHDGRHRRPRPEVELPPLTTPRRVELMAARDVVLQRLWEAHRRRTLDLETEIAAATSDLARLRAELAEARAELAAGELLPELLDQRRAGEEGKSVTLVRARRRREHVRSRADIQGRVTELELRISQLAGRLARLSAERDAERRLTLVRADSAVRLAMLRRTTYDRSLLARHPQGPLVAGLLDPATPRLPGWLLEAGETP